MLRLFDGECQGVRCHQPRGPGCPRPAPMRLRECSKHLIGPEQVKGGEVGEQCERCDYGLIPGHSARGAAGLGRIAWTSISTRTPGGRPPNVAVRAG